MTSQRIKTQKGTNIETMKYTGIFTKEIQDSHFGKDSPIEFTAETRITVEAQSFEEAFYKIANFRFDIFNYDENQLEFDWDFKKIISSQDKTLYLYNGKSFVIDKILKFNGYCDKDETFPKTEPLLLTLDNIKYGLEEGNIQLCDNDTSDGIVYKFGPISISDKLKEFNSVKELTETTQGFSNDIIKKLVMDKVDSLLISDSLLYNEIKDYLFENNKENNKTNDQINYKHIFEGLRSGYIDWSYERYNHELTIFIGNVTSLTLLLDAENIDPFTDGYNGVVLNGECIKCIENKLKDYPDNVRTTILSEIDLHKYDKLPQKVAEVGVNTIGDEIFVVVVRDIRNSEILMSQSFSIDSVDMPFDFRIENLNVSDKKTLNKTLKDYVKPYNALETYIIYKNQDKISNYKYFDESNTDISSLIEQLEMSEKDK